MPDTVTIPADQFEALLHRYYDAERVRIAEYSGDISNDIYALRQEVRAWSREYLGRDFDFGVDLLSYIDTNYA